jgi:methionyl-tRNA formyltransferase
MRLAFMGTAEFAVPPLEKLASAGHEILAVYTQPDRPSGRGRKSKKPPVKEASEALGLDVRQPETLKSEAFEAGIRRLQPALIVVVAYGKILPPWLVDFPEHGVVNLHASLLPRYRGAAPINWAIANGETRTGVCAMKIDRGLDTGPVYRCLDTAIGPEETAPELAARLSRMGADLLADVVDALGKGKIEARPQDPKQATVARRLTKEDGYISWEEPRQVVHDRIRGFLPWPGVVVGFRDERCQLLAARLVDGGPPDDVPPDDATPGEIRIDSQRLTVRCGDGWIEIESLRLPGRRAVRGLDFANGVRLEPGERFTFIGDAGPDRAGTPVH